MTEHNELARIYAEELAKANAERLGPLFEAFLTSLPKPPSEEEQRKSLRDFFAVAVLQGLTADPNISFGTVGKPYDPWPWIVEQAYKAADAMLVERSKCSTNS